MQIHDTLIGYARVSTDDQDLRLQKAALLEPMLLQEHDSPSLRKVSSRSGGWSGATYEICSLIACYMRSNWSI